MCGRATFAMEDSSTAMNVASGILWWKQAELCAGCATNRGDMAVPLAAAVGVNLDLDCLSGFHVGQLSLLEVGGDPDLAKRHNRHEVLVHRNVASHLYRTLS